MWHGLSGHYVRDNLIKHQKKAHPDLFKANGKDGKDPKIKREENSQSPTNGKIENSKPGNGDIDNMIRRFRTFFAPDV